MEQFAANVKFESNDAQQLHLQPKLEIQTLQGVYGPLFVSIRNLKPGSVPRQNDITTSMIVIKTGKYVPQIFHQDFIESLLNFPEILESLKIFEIMTFTTKYYDKDLSYYIGTRINLPVNFKSRSIDETELMKELKRIQNTHGPLLVKMTNTGDAIPTWDTFSIEYQRLNSGHPVEVEDKRANIFKCILLHLPRMVLLIKEFGELALHGNLLGNKLAKELQTYNDMLVYRLDTVGFPSQDMRNLSQIFPNPAPGIPPSYKWKYGGNMISGVLATNRKGREPIPWIAYAHNLLLGTPLGEDSISLVEGTSIVPSGPVSSKDTSEERVDNGSSKEKNPHNKGSNLSQKYPSLVAAMTQARYSGTPGHEPKAGTSSAHSQVPNVTPGELVKQKLKRKLDTS